MNEKLVLVVKIVLLCTACLAVAAGVIYLLRDWLELM